MMVRTAVLKGKDPLKILEDMEIIDKMGIHFFTVVSVLGCNVCVLKQTFLLPASYILFKTIMIAFFVKSTIRWSPRSSMKKY